jgi:DNA polymerase-3 subunit delta
VPAFKPAYLIHGEDHGRIAERRARLRAIAEQQSGTHGVEILEGEAATADAVAAALSAMTFAVGRRFVIVDGAERFKDSELDPLAAVLADPPPETTVVFFAREEGRAKAPPRLHEIVTAAGGAVDAERSAKPWELPKWVLAEARTVGLELDAAAARALVQRVGERQQRLSRELERLALELGPGGRLTAEDVEELAAGSADRRAWSLADALVARDAGAALELYTELRQQGERLGSLLYWMTQRVRQAHDVVTRIEAGEAPGEVRKTLRMPARAAGELVERARRSDVASLRRAIERLADVELETRGGGTLSEDTAAVRAIAAIAS